MSGRNRADCRVLLASIALAVVALSVRVLAQQPAMVVSPNKATMLLGQTHMFRAVGQNGVMRRNVHWSISPEHAAALGTNGDEAVVYARQIFSSVILTAYADGDAAEAIIEIRPGNQLEYGSTIWSVAEMPGCKDKKIIPATPSANGPDIYVQEDCPQGSFIRALAADGRELWRRQIGGPNPMLPPEVAAKLKEDSGERLNLSAKSVCDAVSTGMAKDEVTKLVNGRDLHLEPKQQQSDTWDLEEEGYRCTISFDAKTATVVKKKKTIVTD